VSAQPTAKGIEKYPPDGFYDGEPCTCTEQCGEFGCTGQACSCKACNAGYQDFLSNDWD